MSAWLEGELPGGPAGEPFELAWPIDAAGLEDLRWYLEEYLRAPFGVYGDRGPKVRDRLHMWGDALFSALFGSEAARDAYVRVRAREAVGTEVVVRSSSLAWLVRAPALRSTGCSDEPRATPGCHHRAVKVKRRTHQLKKSAIESLCLAIELFNRPSQVARDQSVMLMVAHSFEMLLKAIIFQKRGTIRVKGEQYTYSFGRCINLAHSELSLLDTADLPMLWAIKQDRNAAAHDTVAFSEDMLWLHVRSAVTIFARLLSAAFKEDLPAAIPSRAIPISALPPTDARAVVEREMQDIAAMLKPGLRQGENAKARIRPLLALDGAVTGREEAPTEIELDRAVMAFRQNKKWDEVFPGLATLEIATTPGAGAQEVSLRISKAGEGPVVRLAKPGEETGALLYRKSDPFDEYGIKLSEFGAKLGVSQSDGYALTWYMKLKDDPAAYYCRKTKAGNIQFQGLSARALDLARKEIARPSFKWSKVWTAYRNRTL